MRGFADVHRKKNKTNVVCGKRKEIAIMARLSQRQVSSITHCLLGGQNQIHIYIT